MESLQLRSLTSDTTSTCIRLSPGTTIEPTVGPVGLYARGLSINSSPSSISINPCPLVPWEAIDKFANASSPLHAVETNIFPAMPIPPGAP